jgi:hypothetical protein
LGAVKESCGPADDGGRLVNGPALIERKDFMRFGSDFAAAGPRRRLALVGLTLAAVLTMCVGTAALRPGDAKAWAWKDTCTLIVTNKSGSQSSVRPILYTPLLPTSTASLALYALRAATGFPTEGSSPFSNTGVPVPSWGCHTFMNFTSPGGTVSCTAEAPTKGANTFQCEGPAATTIIQDDDDIAGEIFIPKRSAHPAAAPDEPSVSGGSVSLAALPGDGWKKSEKISDFGLVGKLMEAEELPAGCGKTDGESTPTDVNTEQAIRANGDEGVGAVVTTYANAAQATDTVQEALSSHSIDCLAKLLNSSDTKVAVQPLPTTEANDGTVDGNQLVISRKGDGGFHPVSYFNVSGWSEGKEAAIELFETVGAAPSESDEAEAATAVRIGN